MDERDFFNETTEQRTHSLSCPHCGQRSEYAITWTVRRKRAQLPRNADERDRARFAKAQSYMVRREDMVGCQNPRCRKRFEITSLQTTAFLTDLDGLPAEAREAARAVAKTTAKPAPTSPTDPTAPPAMRRPAGFGPRTGNR